MLEIENLSCGYDSRLVLQDINLEIKDKDFIGIIGPNGSGKTTLLRAITKIITPKSGRILLEGEDVRYLNFKQIAKKMAMVSQQSQAKQMCVEEFVLLGRIPHYNKFQFFETEKDSEIVKNSMELTDTLKLKDQLIDQISSGERQLALIACALAQEPGLLLLDEPTAHLDISHQVKILDLIKKLNKKIGLTVIMVLHDLNLASEYCDKLVLISNGRIYKTGQPKEVLKYEIIEEVYETVVVVEKNPISSKPYVLLVSETETMNKTHTGKGSEGVNPSTAPQR